MTDISPTEDIINEIAAGKPVILVDDENRENEGDLVIAAEYATPEVINFMITHCRGLVCLALTPEICDRLELPMMAKKNSSRFSTPFTVSIEAREGISTGISPYDRAHTIRTAIHPSSTQADLAVPGHIFPLRANADGVYGREGHTEAAVDLVHLAGCQPAGVICEIIRDDGHMARLPDLIEFAAQHQIKIGTIADLIAYRRAADEQNALLTQERKVCGTYSYR